MAIDTESSTIRLHGIDFARSVLMILGLFYHIGLIYEVDSSWRVVSNEVTPLFNIITDFIHSFRMQAFYLISGFFYMLVLVKNRPGFMKDRVFRAIIPMLFCGTLINPVMNFLSYNFNYDWGINYIIDGDWMGHLWFLGNLTVYFLVSKPVSKFISKFNKINTIGISILFIIAPFFYLAGLNLSYVTYNGNFLFISFKNLFAYYPYFIIGMICFKNSNSFLSLLTLRTFTITLIAYILLSVFSNYDIDFFFGILKIINKFTLGLPTLFMLSLLVSLGKNNSKLIRLCSDSSYTIYLLHQPMIIIFYVYFFNNVSWGVGIEYSILSCSIFVIALFIHIKIVKKSNIFLFLFNGKLNTKNLIKNYDHKKPYASNN